MNWPLTSDRLASAFADIAPELGKIALFLTASLAAALVRYQQTLD